MNWLLRRVAENTVVIDMFTPPFGLPAARQREITSAAGSRTCCSCEPAGTSAHTKARAASTRSLRRNGAMAMACCNVSRNANVSAVGLRTHGLSTYTSYFLKVRRRVKVFYTYVVCTLPAEVEHLNI